MVLPRKRFSVLSHLRNIEYLLDKIYVTPVENPVIAYMVRSWMGLGVVHEGYKIISQESAEKLKQTNPQWFYILSDFN